MSGRVIRLAARLHFQSRLKFALVSSLVAIAALVYLAVSELSRASTENLQQSIETDLGMAGTYRVEFSPRLGLRLPEVLSTFRAATGITDLRVVETYPPVDPECPPYEAVGELSAAILRDASGELSPFEPGVAPSEGDLCLAGLVVPRDAVRRATEAERRSFGAALIIDPRYRDAVRLTTPQPPAYSILIVTGDATDVTGELRQALITGYGAQARQASLDPQEAWVLSRADSGELVRAASDGVRITYLVIGWGVLLSSGLGVLVSELIVLRDRSWFFGLSRAVGARRSDIVRLVLYDTALVLVTGFTMAITLAWVLGPSIGAFGESAFQAPLVLVRPEVVAPLGAAFIALLLIGGVYPAYRAVRLDPAEVLERR